MKTLRIDALETIDSRGVPTVTAIYTTEKGRFIASVPSGASVGAHEAAELRDGGKRLGGRGARKAAENVRTVIAEKLVKAQPSSQSELDGLIVSCDATPSRGVIGANAMLSVSIAGARALAAEANTPLYLCFAEAPLLPCPMMNIINGGAHADNDLDIQEFMIMPAGARSLRDAVDMCLETYMSLKSALKKDGLMTAVGDEGGFAPTLGADESAIEYILTAIKNAGLTPGKDVCLALDAAASGWFDGTEYRQPKSKRSFRAPELLEYYKKLVDAYPIISIEDGMAEDDFEGFAALTRDIGIQIVGDDLFVTNTARIAEGIRQGAANAVLIKPNQIGTVTEAVNAISLSASAGYSCIVSHRSGDTEDSFIADLAVGTACGQIKTGAPCRAERTSKYDRLLMIEHELGNAARFSQVCRKTPI